MNYRECLEREGYINFWEHIPEDEHSRITTQIWEALDRANITLS